MYMFLNVESFLALGSVAQGRCHSCQPRAEQKERADLGGGGEEAGRRAQRRTPYRQRTTR